MAMGHGMGPVWRHMRTDRSATQARLKRETFRRVLQLRRAAPRAHRGLPGPDGRRRRPGRRQPAAGAAHHRRRHHPGRHLPGDLARRRHGSSRRGQRRPHRDLRGDLRPHRGGPDPRPAGLGLRPRAAPRAGLLHPHPDRRPGEPAQQRRHRRPARLHLHAAEHGQQLDRRGGGRRRDARAELAGHAAGAAALPDPGRGLTLGGDPAQQAHPPADGRQRRPRQRDDRALQRRRRDAAQALRPPRRGGRRVHRQGRRGARPRGADRPDHAALRRHPDADPGAGHRPGVRSGRLAGDPGRADDRHPDRAGDPPGAAARPDAGALQRARRRDDRAGELRAGLRGARPADHGPGEARRGRAATRLGRGGLRGRAVPLPARRRGLPGEPGVRRAPRDPRLRGGAARPVLRRTPRRDGGPGGSLRRRQDDDHPPGGAAVRRHRWAGVRRVATTCAT